MERRNVLITGGTGYLGSHIVRSLVENGFSLILLKRSFSDIRPIQEYLERIITYDIDIVPISQIFQENQIHTILHCATNYGRKENDPLQIIEANLLLPVQLLEMGKKNGARCFVNTDTILDKRINYYSLSKKQFRDWLYAYRRDLACVNVAIEHFYGPGDDPTKFVTHIVREFLHNAERIDLTLGEQRRDFIYIDDTVDAFLRIIEKTGSLPSGFYEYEVGSGAPISIREFVELAHGLSGNPRTILNFGAIPYRENEVMNCNADISKISRLGWNCRVPLRTGLQKTIDWERDSLLGGEE